jgi:hypothetical protein
MLNLFQHLLPRAKAWSVVAPTRLRQYLAGLAGLANDVRTFVDLVYLDLFPSTTRELPLWQKQFATSPGGSLAIQRAKVDAAWSIHGRQSPDYLQRAIQAAGFTDVYVHEWWESGPPFVARDPRDYTTPALIGYYQAEASSPWEAFDPGPGDPLAPHADDTLANDPGYFVNLDLTRRAPPPIPDDPARWPFFIYFAGETFPDPAVVPASRYAELKELISRLVPRQQWCVLIVTLDDELDGGGFGAGDFGSAPFGA